MKIRDCENCKHFWEDASVGVHECREENIDEMTWNKHFIGTSEERCPFYKTANEYWLFLEELRRSGKTNMFGAVPYLQEAFKYEEMTRAEASKILTEWMKNYDADDYE